MNGTVDGYVFEQIVNEYQARLNGYARRLTHNREDAEEIVQDTFVRAYRALGRMPAERQRQLHLKAWLYTITLNATRNFLRRKAPLVVSLDSSDVGAQLLTERETPETVLDERASLEEVEAVLGLLPERLRATARMRFIDDRTLAQIAGTFGQPIGTVKSHLHRALNVMRRTAAKAA
jgi:RNA polymerase sigma-70 factor, ECF subfamily